MLERVKNWSIILITYLVSQGLVLVAFYLWWPQLMIFGVGGFFVVTAILAGLLMYSYQSDLKQRVLSVSQILGKEGQEALQIGKMGLMTYDDEYLVTWCSELFEDKQKQFVSQKLTKLYPELKNLFNEEEDKINVELADRIYQVTRKVDARLLYWQDITDIDKLSLEYQQNKLVVGMIHLDNYNETVQNEDEQVIALINSNLRQLVAKWAKNKNIMIRRIRSDRFIVLLKEKQYLELEEEHFPLLDEIRKEAQTINVDITLSMAFARGSNDFNVLDDMVNNLLELAQSRGGDQVVMRIYHREVKYFGGTSEAVEKSSKVKARVIARTIKELVEKSSQIYIVGHLNVDFDCMGAMLAFSKIAQLYNEHVYVIIDNVTMDQQLDEAMHRYFDTIADKHLFLSEEEALAKITDNDLAICVDHHHLGLCNAPELVNAVKRLIVVDHHRRGESFFVNPTLVYVEPSASSSCELAIELLDYQPKTIELEPFESTLMLAGIIVDTDHFRVRSGSRTFEAAGSIKAKGADSSEAESFLREDFEDFEMKNRIYGYSTIVNDTMVIAAVDEEHSFNRGLISQAADDLLNIKNVEASFVIAKTDSTTCIISARSKGRVNVQTIMEKMDGGGHFSAAGLQRENGKITELKEELLQILQEKSYESNTAKLCKKSR